MGELIKLDLKKKTLREVNDLLQNLDSKSNLRNYLVSNPTGNHAVCAGLKDEMEVLVKGHVGYYCAGMNQKALVTIEGNVGTGVAENMMSGTVHVKGNASQSAGATAHGGTLIVDGNTSSRCGISMKGIDIIVKGSVGHMSAFMAQAGNMVICGDAGEALGDSIYEAKLFVKGVVKSLGADCEEKKMNKKDIQILKSLLKKANIDKFEADDFKMYGSARKLYNFNIDNVSEY
jgi:glutamate synthase domain-containing protein 3|tara:strand:+ start:467 stop:1162 length:696 start_codon:yes stop_codon:yes gene_type:complete